ncbi:hypothetical protein [Nocardioides bruguierae]|uniref:hypothetical protein n=1 Tax=Nocardioides bruguierae TaxID=2945102 RepID=UPI002020450F|nr:hypothetical protein [Nocardioides bruguierae]MCL8025446.1 hypothetical protein [Nocardioides bruguierae]
MFSLPRRAFSLVLLLVAALLLPVWLVSSWTTSLVTDTDAYVEAVAPLADEPEVQDAVASRVSGALQQAIEDQLPILSGSAVDNAVDRVTQSVVESEDFPGLWSAANRSVHAGLSEAITDDVPPDVITLDLTPVLDQVVAVLVRRDVLPRIARNRAPEVEVEVARPDRLDRVHDVYVVVEQMDRWLPWILVALVVAAVVITTKRLRALLVAGVLGLLGTGLLAIFLASARPTVLDAVNAASGGSKFLEPTWDALLDSLWRSTAITAVICLAAVLVLGLVSLVLRRR